MTASRDNEEKAQLSFCLLGNIEKEAAVWEFGAKKYTRGNWLQGMEYTKAADSLLRHLVDFLKGQDLDEETQLPLVDHIICSAKILANSFHNYKELDDRGNKDE